MTQKCNGAIIEIRDRKGGNMSRSVFPSGIDTFTELFDLPYNKVNEAKRLTELKMRLSLTNDEQNELISLSNGLEEYLITPETFNKFQDALTAVEEFFFQNVQGFLEEKQEIWDSYIRQFVFVGKWAASKEYKFQNLVSGANGDLYICRVDHRSTTANQPTVSNATWQQLSSKGDKGDIGLNAILKGDWNTTTAYKLGDAVCFGRVGSLPGLTYIALRDNTAKSPDLNVADWMLYQQLYVGATMPAGAQPGLHFIKLI